MAGVPERESIRIHDEYREWMRVFEPIVQLLDDYEQHRHNKSNVSARENREIRMESVVVLLHQVIARTSPENLECFSFIEFFFNF